MTEKDMAENMDTKKDIPLERHPWEPFIPEHARVLIMGTFPPQPKRWSMNFYYPNRTNDFWPMMGLIFYGDRRALYSADDKAFDLDAIKKLLNDKGIALNDTGRAVRRLQNNASDKYLEIVEPVPLDQLRALMPDLRAVVTTGEKAAGVIAQLTGTDVPKIGVPVQTADGLQIWRMPSTSRAYPLALEKKARAYAAMFEATGVLHTSGLLVGSYGSEAEATLHRVSFDSETGEMHLLGEQRGLSNPSYLAIADNGATLLAVAENTDETAALVMLRRNDAGQFVRVAVCPLPGAGPCHVALTPDGKQAVTSNYTAGSITVVDFDGVSGSFGEPRTLQFEGKGADERRQASPHAHFTTFTPDGRLMITADLGSDSLHTVVIGADGKPDFKTLRHIRMAPGSGPRHIVFANNGHTAYLVNEINGTVTRLVFNSTDGTVDIQESVLADYEHGHGSADIRTSADDRMLYVSNRLKGDGIAVFGIDPDNGHLSPAGFKPTGKHPRNFIVAPGGKHIIVAARDDNRLECYRLDPETGLPDEMVSTLSIPRPVCIIPLP